MQRTFSFRIYLSLFACLYGLPMDSSWAERVLSLLRADASRAGLELAWQAQLPTISTSRGLPYVTVFVSPTQTRRVYEVVHGDTRDWFAVGMFDHRGRTLDDAGAAAVADLQMRLLKERGIESQIEVKEIPNVMLLVQTASGDVLALDGETGEVRWEMAIGNPNYPAAPMAGNDRFAIAVNGTRLYVIDVSTGKLLYERILSSIPAGAPVISGKRVLIPTTGSFFETFPLEADEQQRPVGRIASLGRNVSPPQAALGHLIWPTDRGYLYVADPNSTRLSYRIQTRSSIVGRPALRAPKQAFLASADGYVIGVDLETRAILWEVSTGQSIEESPFVAGLNVYVPTMVGQLHCLAVDDGGIKWQVPGVARVLTVSDDRLYARGTDGSLLVIDGDTGVRRADMRLSLATRIVRNPLTDRLYAVNPKGWLRCLRPAGKTWPTILRPLTTESADAPSASEDAPPESPGTGDSVTPADAPTADEPLAEDDPFGGVGTGEEDPFGDSEAGAEDDPFADVEETDSNDPSGDSSGTDQESSDMDDPFG